ncbi:hypothetical protein OHS33_12725 [Streptomyces sp. NBC_00536]|uniref:DUF6269 family protein n=1 Tax=Streptomyces sp. NBC_00536 TaxID=2975769 RepID=UPI002E80B71F|nr:DUF6269 family protein [Streptomyces sp. NBC_00536]WUC79129.1 hypothetical protein OHS33_12725 [Streptomyces sp. NBC_00536]
MNMNENTPGEAQDVLEILAEIEQQGARAQEFELRDSSAPWAALLAEYVDALTSLVAQSHEFHAPAVIYSLDEGHAGGCG